MIRQDGKILSSQRCLTMSDVQAAARIGCGAATVRKRMKSGELKGYMSDAAQDDGKTGGVFRPSLFSVLVDALGIPEPVALQCVLRALALTECNTPPSQIHRLLHGQGNAGPSQLGQRSGGKRKQTSEGRGTADQGNRRRSRRATTNCEAPVSLIEQDRGTTEALRVFEDTLTGSQETEQAESA